ncbi:hypothetical protein TrLO_g11309 [Triparma laevis f. longispina]|uniref:Uncharacterized protein n=1 Tax=Triparma laevis f. longispina TaxID=1714387 RepID=A0A9W6ZTC2_9STRA|nr:hypothetical protein TrLO_g11309 [Triparma laevis f. longispina]
MSDFNPLSYLPSLSESDIISSSQTLPPSSHRILNKSEAVEYIASNPTEFRFSNPHLNLDNDDDDDDDSTTRSDSTRSYTSPQKSFSLSRSPSHSPPCQVSSTSRRSPNIPKQKVPWQTKKTTKKSAFDLSQVATSRPPSRTCKKPSPKQKSPIKPTRKDSFDSSSSSPSSSPSSSASSSSGILEVHSRHQNPSTSLKRSDSIPSKKTVKRKPTSPPPSDFNDDFTQETSSPLSETPDSLSLKPSRHLPSLEVVHDSGKKLLKKKKEGNKTVRKNINKAKSKVKQRFAPLAVVGVDRMKQGQINFR